MLNFDLRKTFDFLPHDILLNKLQHYGFKGTVDTLIQTDFDNRSQRVFWKGKSSTELAAKYGVP